MIVLSLSQNIAVQQDAAHHKLDGAAHPIRYFVSSMLAGMYVGIAVVLMLATAGPLMEAGSPFERLVAGAVFPIALTLVVFAGSELCTSAMMILTQAAITRAVPVGKAAGVLLFNFVGNLAGSMVFGWLVVQSGMLHTNSGAGYMLTKMLEGKSHESNAQLFVRGILCNVLVCVAIWACGRLKSEAGKAIVIFWAVFAFISSGFEHVVANMTTFSLGVFSGGDLTTWSDFGRNMLWVGLGNLVGGAVVIGISYLAVTGNLGRATPEKVAGTASLETEGPGATVDAERA